LDIKRLAKDGTVENTLGISNLIHAKKFAEHELEDISAIEDIPLDGVC
jgi:hypothetical protein